MSADQQDPSPDRENPEFSGNPVQRNPAQHIPAQHIPAQHIPAQHNLPNKTKASARFRYRFYSSPNPQ
jgi:hypothetical protein